MIGPSRYDIESYEPTQLRPEEVKQNDNILKRAFTAERGFIPKAFNFGSMNTLNLNNQLAYNNNLVNNNNRLIYKNYNTAFPTNINLNNPGNITMVNPLLTNKLKQNNIYGNARNSGVINNYNVLKYNNVPTTNINNMAYFNNNKPKYIPKVSQVYPSINLAMNMNRTKYYSNSKIAIPIYRTKLNKKKK